VHSQYRSALLNVVPPLMVSVGAYNSIPLSVSKSKMVYSSLISVDNKLTLICLSTRQQSVTVSVRHAQVILLIWRVLSL